MPGPGVGLLPTVQALGSKPFPGDIAAEAADAVHQLIDQVTVALVEPFGLSEEAVDNRHRLLDPFGVDDQAVGARRRGSNTGGDRCADGGRKHSPALRRDGLSVAPEDLSPVNGCSALFPRLVPQPPGDGTAPGHTASHQVNADEDLCPTPAPGWDSAHRPGAGAG